MKKLFWLWPLCFLLGGCFDLSPDGKTLAISGALWPLASRKSSLSEANPRVFPPVWLVKTDGSGATKIATQEGEFAGFPSFSPDGKRLALRVDLARPDQKVEWRVFDLNSLRSRTFEFGKKRILSAVWSADSRSFYGFVGADSLSSGAKTSEEILQVDAESGRVLDEWDLGKWKMDVSQKWQSDSRGNLLFVASQDGRRDLFSVSPQGLRALTTTGDVADFRENDSGERVWIRAPYYERPRSKSFPLAPRQKVALPPQIWRFDPVSRKSVGAPFRWRPRKG